MPKATRLPLTALVTIATLGVAACGPLQPLTQSVARVMGQTPMPETQALNRSLAPLPKPAAPLQDGFAYHDLRTGETGQLAVTPLDADAVAVRQSDGCAWTRSGDWFAPSDSWTDCGPGQSWRTGKAEVRVQETLWPLEVGAVGRYERDAVSSTGRSYTRATTCTVRDAVAVLRDGQAPTPAFVVECVDGKRVRTTWYAPGEGPIAFRKWHETNGVEEAWVRL